MENCLVKELKASVSNDNMPILNTIVLDDYTDVPAEPNILIMADSSIPVKLLCKVPMYTSTSYTDGVTEKTITGTNIIRFKQSEVQALSSKKDFLKITGGIFNIKKIGNSFLSMNNLLKSGLSALEYSQSLVCFGSPTVMSEPIKDLPTSIEFIMTGKVYNEWFASPYSLKVLSCGTSGGSFIIPLNSYTQLNTSVKTMSWVGGDIKNLPKNILRCDLVYETSGSIEELVASMVSRGRTSGSIKFSIASSTYVTYNGTRLGTLYTGNKVLVWNNSTITWQDNDTEETAAAPVTSMYAYPVS